MSYAYENGIKVALENLNEQLTAKLNESLDSQDITINKNNLEHDKRFENLESDLEQVTNLSHQVSDSGLFLKNIFSVEYSID